MRTGLRPPGDLSTDAGVERVVTAIYASRGKSFWSRFASTVQRDEFERSLREGDRSRRALFDAAMRAFAQGRPVAGDKTPEHIYAVPTLLAWFPQARVVHTFRDPRAIYVSLRRKERAEKLSRAGYLARLAGPVFDLYASTNLALRWRRMARLHRRYAAEFPGRYTLQRFEDTLADPEGTVRRLCDFIGIAYDPAMLDQVVHNSSYAPKRSGAGIDRSTAERWRQHLPKATGRWLSLLCGSELAPVRLRTLTSFGGCLVRGRVAGRLSSGAEFRFDPLTGAPPEARPFGVVCHEIRHRRCQGGRVAGRHQDAALPVHDHLAAAGHVGGDDGQTGGHSFEQSHRQALPE